MLIEDFGDVRMRETVDAVPESTLRLYEAAIDILVRLRGHEAGDVPPYDRAVLHREAGAADRLVLPGGRAGRRSAG